MSRFDRWDRSGMPDSAANYAIQKGIDQTMRSVIQDTWARPISKSASMLPPQREETPRAPSGGSVDIKPPAGVEHVDRIAESFARQDKIAAIRQARENAWIEQQLDRSSDNKVKTSYDPLKKFDREQTSLHGRNTDDGR